jgi:hypothetical protein
MGNRSLYLAQNSWEERGMRVPVSHPIVLTAALWLTAAATDETSQVPVWNGASVSEKLRIIRQSLGSVDTIAADERPAAGQKWRNCISGYWRNC